jgi:phosphoribosylformylglycinamidine cyclo-ligase
MAPDEYDIAGAGTGIVDAQFLLGPAKVREGDAVIAMASSGLHSNGYSLARHVLLGDKGPGLHAHIDEFGRTVGEEMLVPTAIYTKDCLTLIRNYDVHAFSHVTGGGLAANLARVLPVQLAADVDRATWRVPAVFNVISTIGSVSQAEMERTFNMGIGMFAIVAASDADAVCATLSERGVNSWVCGSIRARQDGEPGDAAAKGGAGGAATLRGAPAT